MKNIDIGIIVNEAVAEVLDIKLDKIIEDSTLADLGADSLYTVEIEMLIEKRFNNAIAFDYNNTIPVSMTVKKLHNFVCDLVEPK